jgi:hypothetical protein
MINDFIQSKKPIIEELLDKRPDSFDDVVYQRAIKYTLLCYADDSPLHERFQDIDQKREYCEREIGCVDVPTEDGSLYLHLLEEYLTKFQHSYRYEFLITCHILLSDNNRELRKPINIVGAEDKRMKMAEIRTRLLQNNKEIIELIDQLNKTIFGQNDQLKKKFDNNKRLSVEERVKNNIK